MVFLTGADECERAVEAINNAADRVKGGDRKLEALPLYAGMARGV